MHWRWLKTGCAFVLMVIAFFSFLHSLGARSTSSTWRPGTCLPAGGVYDGFLLVVAGIISKYCFRIIRREIKLCTDLRTIK